MIQRPHNFNEIIGHTGFKRYFQERIRSGNLPQFLILEGPEGLGKTSLAEIIAVNINYGEEDTPERQKAVEAVIDQRKSIDCIKKYNMAKDSGKDTAKEVLAELTANMSTTGRKVVICDECHAIREDAQDVFLVETESLPKNVYLIMCTTKKSALKPTLLSRAACIPLHPLTISEMQKVLTREVERRGLRIQAQEQTLRMIAEWADNKPRAALNILNAFGENGVVSREMVQEFIGYMDISEVLPLLEALGGSMTFGLSYIADMKLGDNLVDKLVELLCVKEGRPSYKMSVEEYRSAKLRLEKVPEESIIKFIHQIATLPRLTRSGIIAAFVSSHVAFEKLLHYDKSVKNEELVTRTENMAVGDINTLPEVKAPSLEDLLANSAIIED